MTEQVAHGYLAGDVGIEELKSREILCCRVIQLNFALINQHRDGCGSESL